MSLDLLDAPTRTPTSRFVDILELVHRGPQCPCGIANEVGLLERDVYALLAEMLARKWLVVVLPAPTASARYSNGPAIVRLRREVEADIGPGMPSSDDEVIRYTLTWYEFFREVANLDQGEGVVYYVGLTDAGLDALQKLREPCTVVT